MMSMRSPRYPKLHDVEWLRAERVANKRSKADLAREIGCSNQAVANSLWRYGVEDRPEPPDDPTIAAHGLSHTKAYSVWSGMIARCTNPSSYGWPWYGGRGIRVCDRWKAFEAFYADMGNPPDGLTLDRINNDGDYEPDNCRWVDWTTQANNRRPGTTGS